MLHLQKILASSLPACSVYSPLLPLPPPLQKPSGAGRRLVPGSLSHVGDCDAERRLLSITPKGECRSEGMVSGKKTKGSVRTCQRKAERKSGRKERKVNGGGTKSHWRRRQWSEPQVRGTRVRGLTLQRVGRRFAAHNHNLLTGPRRRAPRELPSRSGASTSRLRFLVWWMSTVRFRSKESSHFLYKRVMCYSSKAYGVEESKHHCPPAHTAHRHHDLNNNLQNHKLSGKPTRLEKNRTNFVSRGAALIRRLQSKVNCLSLRKREPVKLDSFAQFKRLLLIEIPSRKNWNIKSCHKRVNHLGARTKEYWRSGRTGDPGTVEGIGKPILWESGAEGGQRRGGKTPEGDNRGRQWWVANGSNSESGDEQGHCRGQPGNGSSTTPDAAATNQAHHRSFDVFSSRRKKASKSSEGIRRSISIDQSKSDDTFFSLAKYRDKSVNRENKTDTISSSSEDPAADLRIVLRARPSKSSDRRRSGVTRRNEAGHKRTPGEHSRSRRRQTKKVERSPSSRSSSSSRSGSATRARAVGGLAVMSSPRVKKSRSPKETAETSFPVEDQCKDETKEFLRKLDSVLTDLVEREKRRISSYGQPSIQNPKEEDPHLKRTSKKKNHKHKHRKVSKERDHPQVEEEVSPALQQLRATLKTVRVRKRPTPQSADVLETHAQCFTEKQPHNPRILKSQHGSQLVTHRYYQPPRRRQPRSHPYPPDFCSSDEDKPTVGRTYQDEAQKEYVSENPSHDRRAQGKSSHKEDEEDTCYGSDYQGPQGPPVRRPAPSPSHVTQRLMEAADSGDHSVDSAYTGSRGATPESILYPSVKPRRTGSSLTTPSTGARPRTSRFTRCSPKAERLQQLKRNILNEIRENGLYSDESINSLLDQYRRRYCHFPSADLDLVTRSIQEDLGVKPRPAEYLYQILIASEDDQSPSGPSNLNGAMVTENAPDRKTPSPIKPQEFQVQRKVSQEQMCQANPPTLTQNNSEGNPLLDHGEVDDEAWAKSMLKEVAPQLVQEAKDEASGRQDDGDPECASYVTELCHQLQLNI